MPNYRGGDPGISSFAASTAHKLESGTTQHQKDREFKRRVMLAAAQAALQGIAGGVSGAWQERQDMNRQKAARAESLRNEAVSRASSNLEKSFNADRNRYKGLGDIESYPMGDVPYIKEIGNAGLAQDDANKSAAGAPVTWGGKQQYTPSGLDDMVQNANVVGSDENLGKNIIRSTGSDFVDNNRPEMNTALSPRDAYGGLLNSKVR